jgi:hypothetical protein
MTASIRIRYRNSVAVLPSRDGTLRGPDAFSSRRRLPPFNRIVRGYQPQNWSGVLRQWSSFTLLGALHHACKQSRSRLANRFKNLLGVGVVHVPKHGASERAEIRNVVGEIRNVVR